MVRDEPDPQRRLSLTRDSWVTYAYSDKNSLASTPLASGTATNWLTALARRLLTQAQGQLGLQPTAIVGSNLKVAGKTRTVPSWSDVKAKLAQFDRPGLVGLLGDLHSLSRENQTFLHARLGLGADPLGAYKRTISRWVYPDIVRNQDVSVAKGKKAITDYRKAIGLPEGLAELSVFYCETAVRFSAECGFEDEGFFASLVRMFEQALIALMGLPLSHRQLLLERLDRVRSIAKAVGWDVKDAMDELWAEQVLSD